MKLIKLFYEKTITYHLNMFHSVDNLTKLQCNIRHFRTELKKK